jgi:hypothetical protein
MDVSVERLGGTAVAGPRRARPSRTTAARACASAKSGSAPGWAKAMETPRCGTTAAAHSLVPVMPGFDTAALAKLRIHLFEIGAIDEHFPGLAAGAR